MEKLYKIKPFPFQAAKPVAKYISNRAKESKVFRDWICMPIAQRAHIWEVKAKMRSLNLGSGRVTKVPPLSEAKAVEQGSELLSELIIYSIASFIVVYEYDRSSDKDQAKEAKLEADRQMIKGKITELEELVVKQNSRIEELSKVALDLEKKSQSKNLERLKSKEEDPSGIVKESSSTSSTASLSPNTVNSVKSEANN